MSNLQEEIREGEKQKSRWKTKQPASVGERGGCFGVRKGDVLEQATSEGRGDLFPHYISSKRCCSLPCVKPENERERDTGLEKEEKKGEEEGLFPSCPVSP